MLLIHCSCDRIGGVAYLAHILMSPERAAAGRSSSFSLAVGLNAILLPRHVNVEEDKVRLLPVYAVDDLCTGFRFKEGQGWVIAERFADNHALNRLIVGNENAWHGILHIVGCGGNLWLRG